MGSTSGKTPQGRNSRIESLENATALLLTLQATIEQTSEHSLSITGMAMEGERAITHGNVRMAAAIFGDVQQASRQQRDLLARAQVAAEQARVMVAAARVGK